MNKTKPIYEGELKEYLDSLLKDYHTKNKIVALQSITIMLEPFEIEYKKNKEIFQLEIRLIRK